MDIIVDANVLFAALLKQGSTVEVLFRNDLRLHAPENLLFIFMI